MAREERREAQADDYMHGIDLPPSSDEEEWEDEDEDEDEGGEGSA